MAEALEFLGGQAELVEAPDGEERTVSTFQVTIPGVDDLYVESHRLHQPGQESFILAKWTNRGVHAERFLELTDRVFDRADELSVDLGGISLVTTPRIRLSDEAYDDPYDPEIHGTALLAGSVCASDDGLLDLERDGTSLVDELRAVDFDIAQARFIRINCEIGDFVYEPDRLGVFMNIPEGGTDNTSYPAYEFMAATMLPEIERTQATREVGALMMQFEAQLDVA